MRQKRDQEGSRKQRADRKMGLECVCVRESRDKSESGERSRVQKG